MDLFDAARRLFENPPTKGGGEALATRRRRDIDAPEMADMGELRCRRGAQPATPTRASRAKPPKTTLVCKRSANQASGRWLSSSNEAAKACGASLRPPKRNAR
jgi:hypothetical protein